MIRQAPIPVQPIHDYIERHYGGASHLPGMGVMIRREGTGSGRHGGHTFVRETIPTERRRLSNLRNRLNDACDGEINMYIADEICVDYLGVHPMMVYGMEWFEFHTDEPVEVEVDPFVLGVAA